MHKFVFYKFMERIMSVRSIVLLISNNLFSNQTDNAFLAQLINVLRALHVLATRVRLQV